MEKIAQLLIISSCFAVWCVLVFGHSKGNFGDKSYQARIRWFKNIIGEKFDDKMYYKNWLKKFYRLTWIAGCVIYIFLLFMTLKS
jgi:hypothetical protein